MAAPGMSKFLAAILSAMSQLLPPSISRPLPPPQPQPAADIENVAEVDADQDPSPSFTDWIKYCPSAPPNLNWSKLVIAFCFGSALEITHQSQSQSQLPSTLYYFLLCFAISVSFSCIFVAKFIGSKFFRAAQVLENLGVFFAVTAFFLAVASPFPVSLKCTILALYALSLFAILLSNLL